jgi:hypothetical protein
MPESMAVAKSVADGYQSNSATPKQNRLSEMLEIYNWMEYANREDMNNFEEAFNYYNGKQWTDEEVDLLTSDGRPPLAFNLVFGKVNTVTGLEQQIRSGFKATPVGAEDDELALLATALLKFEDRNKQMQKVFSRAFKTAIICGRGWIDIGTNFIPGEVTLSNKIRNENVFNVYKDPDSVEYDMSDAHYLLRQKWLSIPQLKRTYPEIFMAKTPQEIGAMLNFERDARFPRRVQEMENDYSINPNIHDWSSFVDNNKRRAKVIELYEKRVEYQWYVVGNTGMKFPANDKKQALEITQQLNQEAQTEAQEQGAEVEIVFAPAKVAENRIYMTCYSGNMVIRDTKLIPFKHNSFPIVPVYAYMEDSGKKVETFGVVKNLIDPQDEKNKRHSQFVDILNRAPKGGGFFQQSAIDSEQLKALSTPGAWVGVKGSIKDKILPSTHNFMGILSHYQWLEQTSQNDTKEISGINDSLIGIPTNSRESGVAAQTRIQQGLTTLQELFDHLNTAKRLVVEQVMSNIQQFYDMPKIQKIVGIIHRDNPEFLANAPMQLIQRFYDLNYDILIDEGESSPTARIASVQSAKELLQYAQSMPPTAVMTIVKSVIDMSDFPGKREMLEQLSGAQSQALMEEAMMKAKQQIESEEANELVEEG